MTVRVETEKGEPGSRRDEIGFNSAPRNSKPAAVGEKNEFLFLTHYIRDYGIMRARKSVITVNIEITQAPMAMKKSIHSLAP